MKKMSKYIVGILFVFLVPISIYAGTSYASYSLYLPGVNGSASTGYSQIKAISGANGNITVSTSTQKFDARMQSSDGDVDDWVRQISKGDSAGLPGNSGQLAGESMRLTLSSNWNATADTKIGTWRSN